MKLIAILAMVLPGTALAQTAPPTAAPAPIQAIEAAPAPVVAIVRPSSPTYPVLAANTELLLTLNSDLSSKHTRVGDTFDLTVSHDVMLGQYVVIPKGTPAHGVVTFRTGKGAFGKSGKMEVEMRAIDLGSRSIPISGHYRQEGEGNTGATVGTAVAVGVFAAFVTGHSADYHQGAEFKAFTKDALPVVLPNQPTQ